MRMALTASATPPLPVVTMTVTPEFPLDDLLDELHAAQARHAQVGDEDAVGPGEQRLEGLRAVFDGVDLEPQRQLQELLERHPRVLVVLGDQDCAGPAVGPREPTLQSAGGGLLLGRRGHTPVTFSRGRCVLSLGSY